MRLSSPVQSNQFFRIEKMKNNRSTILFFCVILSATIFVSANENVTKIKAATVNGSPKNISIQVDRKNLSDELESRNLSTEGTTILPTTSNISEDTNKDAHTQTHLPNDQENSTRNSSVAKPKELQRVLKDVTNETTRKLLLPEEVSNNIKENVSEELSKLPKRHIDSWPDQIPQEQVSQARMQEALTSLLVEKTQGYSWKEEALKFCHQHASAIIIQEIFSEAKKLLQSLLLAGENFKSEFVTEFAGVAEKTRFLFEQGLEHLRIALENSNNFEILLNIIEGGMLPPIIREIWFTLQIVIAKFSQFMEELVANFQSQLEGNMNGGRLIENLQTEILLRLADTSNLHRGYFPNFEGLAPIFRIISIVESLFRQFFIPQPFYQLLEVGKEFVDFFQALFSGYDAFSFSQFIFDLLPNFVRSFFQNIFKAVAITGYEGAANISPDSLFLDASIPACTCGNTDNASTFPHLPLPDLTPKHVEAQTSPPELEVNETGAVPKRTPHHIVFEALLLNGKNNAAKRKRSQPRFVVNDAENSRKFSRSPSYRFFSVPSQLTVSTSLNPWSTNDGRRWTLGRA